MIKCSLDQNSYKWLIGKATSKNTRREAWIFRFNKMDMMSFFVINKKEKVVVSGWIHFLCVSNKRMDFGSNFHFCINSIFLFEFVTSKPKIFLPWSSKSLSFQCKKTWATREMVMNRTNKVKNWTNVINQGRRTFEGMSPSLGKERQVSRGFVKCRRGGDIVFCHSRSRRDR